MTKMLEVRHLSKVVSERGSELVLLEDINFSLRAGEVAAIQGPSGAGKSTLLGLLAGLDLPTRGQVLLEGQDIFALDENARASLRGRLIGFVFQSFQLLPALTALENVMLPLELANRPQARLRARDILARVGLEHRLGHYPAQLSGGEQQRVAVARAFAIEPPLLLADEPTGNLDQQTGERVIELLFSLNAERQATLVLVTHDANLAARCERQIRLDSGRLLEPT